MPQWGRQDLPQRRAKGFAYSDLMENRTFSLSLEGLQLERQCLKQTREPAGALSTFTWIFESFKCTSCFSVSLPPPPSCASPALAF
eukprot:763953-Hanusia_phi.AAC.4